MEYRSFSGEYISSSLLMKKAYAILTSSRLMIREIGIIELVSTKRVPSPIKALNSGISSTGMYSA